MTRKCALIVDDSKTARQVLAKKLQAYQIDIETADSAVTAIDFLYGNTPDAVFMDYEMPGMDGFQALKIIKSNPKTATIPVMMYTSKEGGIVLSQARALGAIGVLPKKMEAGGLESIIEQLHLLPHQQSLVENFHDELDQYRSKVTFPTDINALSNVEYLNKRKDNDEKVEYPEEIFDESVFVLKRQTRIFLKELMSAEKRISNNLSKEVGQVREELKAEAVLQEEIPKRHKDKKGFLILLNILMLLLIGYLVWQQSVFKVESKFSDNIGLIGKELTDVNGQVRQLVASLQNGAQLSLVDNEANGNPEELNQLQPNIEFLSWAANRGTGFQYGENPFNDVRIAWLSELVNQLDKAGFSGVINLKAHYGNFCLSKSETGGIGLARDDLRFDDCLFSGASKESGFTQSSYQTIGFANYLNSIVSDKEIPIEVFVEADSYDEPILPYPESYAVKSAGDWNRIAVQNQRILVNLYQKMEF